MIRLPSDKRASTTLLFWLCAVAISLSAAVVLYAAIAIVVSPGEVLYGEGIVLAQALRFARGGPLYGPFGEAPYSVTAYTPLYYLVVAALSFVFGPSFEPGRIVALLSILGTAVLIALTLKEKGSLGFGVLAAGLFLIQPAVSFWLGLHRVDTLALLLSFAGFYVAQRGKVALSAPLFVLAAFTKQTFVLSATAEWLTLLYQRKPGQALKFATLVGVMSIALLAFFQVASGGNFLHHVVDANRNPYDPYMVYDWLLTVRTSVVPLLVAGILGVLLLDRTWAPWKLYFGLSLVHIMLLGKVGAHYNYFLEPIAVSAVLAGGLLVRFRYSVPRLSLAAALAVILLAAFDLPATLESASDRYRDEPQRASEVNWAVEKVEQTPGPVISEDIGVLALARRDITFEYVVFAILWSTGDWSEEQFLSDIRGGRYPALLLTGGDDPLSADCYCFSPAAWTTLREHFEPVAKFGRYSYYRYNGTPRSVHAPPEAKAKTGAEWSP